MRITFTSCHYCLGVAGPQDVRREMQSRVTEAPAASHKPARGAAMSADAAFLQIRILPPVRVWRIPALPTYNATSAFGIYLSGYRQQSPLFGSGNNLCSVRVEMAQCRVCAPWPELELGSEHQSFGPPKHQPSASTHNSMRLRACTHSGLIEDWRVQ